MRGEQGTVWPEADDSNFSFPAQSQGSGQGCQLCLQGSLQLCFNPALGKELLIPGQVLGLSPSKNSMGTQLASHIFPGSSHLQHCLHVKVCVHHSEPSLQARGGEVCAVRSPAGFES